MSILTRNLVLCLIFALAYANACSAAENTDMPEYQGDIRIEGEGSLLSLETNNAPLHDVIREIGKAAGFKTILAEDFVEPLLLNAIYKNIPVNELVERLVSDKNRIIFYKRAKDETGQRIISQVWLLGSSSESGDTEFSNDESFAATSQNSFASGGEDVVKGHKLIRLTKMLQADQEIQVRTRAAIALGKLRDKGAVLALESALLDQHSSVRSQAINALGQIGSEQATIVLGNLLLNSGADISERIMAAEALWKHDSIAAQIYLRAGKFDTEKQIRVASSKQSSTPKVGASNNQLDDTEAQ